MCSMSEYDDWEFPDVAPSEEKYVNNGWIKEMEDAWISPGGRIADYPGGAFYGQLSKAEHKELKEAVARSEDRQPERQDRAVEIRPIVRPIIGRTDESTSQDRVITITTPTAVIEIVQSA